jgi:hypothetical protein
MEIKSSTFTEIPANSLGIVILGCDLSTKQNRDDFVNGVTHHLAECDVIVGDPIPEMVWKNIYQTTTPLGRTDLIFECINDKFNIGQFAMARLSLPDCSWIEDWLVNYADSYNVAQRGPHAAAVLASEDEDVSFEP